ncbi:MAG: NUDIX hydrolase [Planctomycetota bacterium]
MQPDQSPTPWQPGPRRTLATTRILSVHAQQFTCTDHPSRSGEFTVLESRDWVNVLALTPGDTASSSPDGIDRRHAVLVEQFRFGVARNTIEIPGGIIDPGEDPIEAGVRELLEETGYAGDAPRVLGTVDANPAILTNIATTILIENARRMTDPEPDEHEQIRVLTRPVAALPAMIANGDITNAVVVAALFHWFASSDENHRTRTRRDGLRAR